MEKLRVKIYVGRLNIIGHMKLYATSKYATRQGLLSLILIEWDSMNRQVRTNNTVCKLTGK